MDPESQYAKTVFKFVDRNAATRDDFASQTDMSRYTAPQTTKIKEFIRQQSEIKLQELSDQFAKVFKQFEPKFVKRERHRRCFSTLPVMDHQMQPAV